MLASSPSSDTMPSRRAWFAYFTRASIVDRALSPGSRNTFANRRNALRTTLIWKLNQDRAQRSSKHDHGGRGLDYLAHIATFDNQTKKDASQGQHHTGEGCQVHVISYFSPAVRFSSSITGIRAERLSHHSMTPCSTDRRNCTTRSRTSCA